MKGYILLFAIFFISCGPSAKLRRAERLIAKAEQQGAVWHSDTLFTTVEIPVPEVRTDTIFEAVEGDTVVISKDRLEIKYVKLPGENVYIEGECKSDTVIKEVPITITKTIEAKSGFPWWWLVIVGLACIGLSRVFWR